MNHFSENTAAERYSKGRPNFHNNTINHIRHFLRPENKFNSALDIACGTGLSTQALLNIAEYVDGTDSSQAMLDLALQKDKINYQLACAEKQPFADNTFDLITVCSGVHWFDIDKFLNETNRLLKNQSWLIIYDNFFLGVMEGKPQFKHWYEAVYLKEFPAPARSDKYNWTYENLDRVNFNFVKQEIYNNGVSLNRNDLALYFTTQSNIISAVENKKISYEEVEIWLNKQLNSFFENEEQTRKIQFGNWIKYLQKFNRKS